MSIQGNWDRRFTRRDFLKVGGMSAAALTLSANEALARPRHGGRPAGFGGLVEDKRGLLDLPRGFRYRVISPQFYPRTLEEKTVDGETVYVGEPNWLDFPREPVPGDHDGMAALRGPRNTTILVRNHELSPGDIEGDAGDREVPGFVPYDPGQPGGTTGIVVGRNGRVIQDYVTSSGTNRNCSGGPTPWNTWLTCEETRIRAEEDDQATKDHGYVFEVLPYGGQYLSAQPIKDMGFFSHEAVNIDPRTGIAYLTEDDFRGEIPDNPRDEVADDDDNPNNEVDFEVASRSSFLYRFVPNAKNLRPGAYLEGGKLQALGLREPAKSRISNNADLARQGQSTRRVRWIDVNPEEASADALAKGALRFNRLEGADFAGGAFWFNDTAGGEERLGQTFRLIPGRDGNDRIELFFESDDPENMQSPDNTVVAPWGDLWFCEDGEGDDRVMGITPNGQTYEFARNRLNDSELAGCTFSPDGRTFFVNIQNPGLTFVIQGPFWRINRRRRRQLAYANPPAGLGPNISGELAEAAEEHGLSPLEAAVYDRAGYELT